MIDNSPPGSWTRDKGLDLRSMTSWQLSDPALIEKVRKWHGFQTAGEALVVIGKERKRRTRETS